MTGLYPPEHGFGSSGLKPGSRRLSRLAELRELLELSWSQLEAPGETRSLELDEETRRRLKALGYLQ